MYHPRASCFSKGVKSKQMLSSRGLLGLQAAMQLLERREWHQVLSVVGTMAVVAVSEQHQQRALQVRARLALSSTPAGGVFACLVVNCALVAEGSAK